MKRLRLILVLNSLLLTALLASSFVGRSRAQDLNDGAKYWGAISYELKDGYGYITELDYKGISQSKRCYVYTKKGTGSTTLLWCENTLR